MTTTDEVVYFCRYCGMEVQKGVPCSACAPTPQKNVGGKAGEPKVKSERREEGNTTPRVAYETNEYIAWHEHGMFFKQYKLPFGGKS